MLGKVDVWNMALSRIGETVFVQDETAESNTVRIATTHWDRIVREVLERKRWPWACGFAILTELSTQTATHAGDGAQRDFAIDFDLPDNSEVTVTVDGTVAEISTDYTVEYPEGEGVTPYVSFTAAPSNGAAIVITYTPAYNGWEHVYALPADFVQGIGLVPEGEKWEDIPPELRIPYTIVPNATATGFVLLTDAEQGDTFERFAYVRNVNKPHLWKGGFTDAVAWRLAAEFARALGKDPAVSNDCLRNYEMALAGAGAHALNEGQPSKLLKSPTVRARR